MKNIHMNKIIFSHLKKIANKVCTISSTSLRINFKLFLLFSTIFCFLLNFLQRKKKVMIRLRLRLQIYQFDKGLMKFNVIWLRYMAFDWCKWSLQRHLNVPRNDSKRIGRSDLMMLAEIDSSPE